MTTRAPKPRAAVALACLALASMPHLAQAQTADGDTGARSPIAGGLGIVLALAGAPFVVAGGTLLANGVARDEPRHKQAIDDLETSGGVLLLGTGGVLIGAGVPTIVWGFGSEDETPKAAKPRPPRRAASAAPTVVVQPTGASAGWVF